MTRRAATFTIKFVGPPPQILMPDSFFADKKIQHLHWKAEAVSICCAFHLTSTVRCSYRWPKGVSLSKEAKDLIQSLLKRDPQERPSANQLLNHAWVRSCRPVSARALLVASKKLLEGQVSKNPMPDHLALQSRGDSPLVQQLIADARLIPKATPWPPSPGLDAPPPPPPHPPTSPPPLSPSQTLIT